MSPLNMQAPGKEAKPLVSIIIICYNYGRYLGEAIESALSQTYQLTEVIVVNDGSTDDTVEVASRYPVTLINQTHQGIAAAVNRGVASAKGKYYLLLSADDKLDASYIEKAIRILEKNPDITFVYTHMVLFDAQNGILISREYDVNSLKKGNYISGTALTRREAFDTVGGYDPHLQCLEDWDHWLSFAEKGLYGKLLPEPLLYWRRHATGSRNTAPPEVVRAVVRRIRRKHSRLFTPQFLIIDFIMRVVRRAVGILLRASIGRISPKMYEKLRNRLLRKIGRGAYIQHFDE